MWSAETFPVFYQKLDGLENGLESSRRSSHWGRARPDRPRLTECCFFPFVVVALAVIFLAYSSVSLQYAAAIRFHAVSAIANFFHDCAFQPCFLVLDGLHSDLISG